MKHLLLATFAFLLTSCVTTRKTIDTIIEERHDTIANIVSAASLDSTSVVTSIDTSTIVHVIETTTTHYDIARDSSGNAIIVNGTPFVYPVIQTTTRDELIQHNAVIIADSCTTSRYTIAAIHIEASDSIYNSRKEVTKRTTTSTGARAVFIFGIIIFFIFLYAKARNIFA